MKKISTILFFSGFICIFSAVIIILFNINSSNNAGEKSKQVIDEFKNYISESENSSPEDDEVKQRAERVYEKYQGNTDTDNEITYEEEEFILDGNSFIAIISVPSLSIELPVRSFLSMENLKSYPCRYTGKIYDNNLIIAAHNYDSHFGNIKNLCSGDEVDITDAQGKVFKYIVEDIEIIDGTAIESMQAGDWDLTLFTCTLSGKSRVTVRCYKSEEL